jgi:hypothetical protein
MLGKMVLTGNCRPGMRSRRKVLEERLVHITCLKRWFFTLVGIPTGGNRFKRTSNKELTKK